MAMYRVLNVFIDTHTKKEYQIGEEIELSNERFMEVEKNLLVFGGGFIEPVKKTGKKTNKSLRKEG